MIIGTPGHIDHGKTSLVKSLTGFDADRLKEAEALAATLRLEAPQGLAARQFAIQWDLTDADRQDLLFAPGQLERCAEAVTQHLGAHHRKSPDSPGLVQETLQRAIRDKPVGAVCGWNCRRWSSKASSSATAGIWRWPATTRRCKAPRSRSGNA